MRVLLSLCLLCLVTGCSTYSLQELKTATPKGTPFQAALAVRYMQFSEEKAAKYNWMDSNYFADKGLKSAYGHDVGPENVHDWNIPRERRPELEEAHAALVRMLETNAKETQPKLAADAQYYFDCWVEYQQLDWQPDQIAYCRDGYRRAMSRLRGGAAEPEEIAEPEAEPQARPVHKKKAEAVPAPDRPQKQAYIVFFGMNRDGLDEQGERLMDGLVKELKNQDGYVAVVNGHTDTVGDKRYNFELSRRRAQAVMEQLIERGIPRKRVRSFGFGDTDPKVPTGPGIAEPKNRRVEIYIGDQ